MRAATSFPPTASWSGARKHHAGRGDGDRKWSEDRSVAKFKGYANMNLENAPKHTQANFTLMPWVEMASMPEQDLRAIYIYLRTLKPVYNSVEVHPPQALAQAR